MYLWIYGRRKYLGRLNELIQADVTAKMAYKEKEEGISFDHATRKRIVNATRKTKAMASNKSRL